MLVSRVEVVIIRLSYYYCKKRNNPLIQENGGGWWWDGTTLLFESEQRVCNNSFQYFLIFPWRHCIYARTKTDWNKRETKRRSNRIVGNIIATVVNNNNQTKLFTLSTTVAALAVFYNINTNLSCSETLSVDWFANELPLLVFSVVILLHTAHPKRNGQVLVSLWWRSAYRQSWYLPIVGWRCIGEGNVAK